MGEHQALSEAEQAAVRQAIIEHQPRDLGLRGQLWTRARVGALIAKLYRVRLTEQGVGKCLRHWGLTFQRPDKRAIEQNVDAACVQREEAWPTLRLERGRSEACTSTVVRPAKRREGSLCAAR